LDTLAAQMIAILLVSLRIAPTLSFAPPFTLLRMPALVRVILGVALAGWLVAANPALWAQSLSQNLAAAFLSELLLGLALAITLQIAFAALLTMGRALEFQAGFGMAVLADPTFRAQTPLLGMLFAYGAGAIFFATGGPADLLAIWARSLELAPLGSYAGLSDLAPLLSFLSAAFALGLSVGALVMVVLFLLDCAIALASRTLPQMNVLFLGFQLKTIALLATMPIALAVSGAGLLRLIRLALDAAPRTI